jgi:hypothetical protein
VVTRGVYSVDLYGRAWCERNALPPAVHNVEVKATDLTCVLVDSLGMSSCFDGKPVSR